MKPMKLVDVGGEDATSACASVLTKVCVQIAKRWSWNIDIDSIIIFVMSRARDAVQEMHPEKIFELQENKEMYIKINN